MNKFLKRSHGFTFVDLLVLIAILGILAAVLIPPIGRIMELNDVWSAVNELMEDRGLTYFSNPVISSQATNNMGIFPEAENPLYPFYLERQFTRHSYWVEVDGTVYRSYS